MCLQQDSSLPTLSHSTLSGLALILIMEEGTVSGRERRKKDGWGRRKLPCLSGRVLFVKPKGWIGTRTRNRSAEEASILTESCSAPACGPERRGGTWALKAESPTHAQLTSLESWAWSLQFMEELPLPLLVCEWSIVTKDAGKVYLSTISDYADSKPWRHTPLKEWTLSSCLWLCLVKRGLRLRGEYQNKAC